MKRKRWNTQEKKLEEVYKDNLIITIEEAVPRTKLEIYNDLVFLKIRPVM